MPLNRTTERQLILECQESRQKEDLAAFEAPFASLFRGHYAAVMAISRRLTRNREDAEEVANDAFTDLNDKILIVDPDKGCFGLLRQLAFRRAAEKYARRNDRLRAQIEIGLDPEKHHEPISPDPLPDTELLIKEAVRIRQSDAARLERIVFGRESGPPHERMVYLFHRKLRYKPARLVEHKFSERKLGEECELSGARIEALEQELENEWVRRTGLRPEQVAGIFAPLRGDLMVLLCCYPLHGSTQKLYKAKQMWELPISQGRLREYFHTSPSTEDIRMWWVNVEKRVVKLAKNSGLGKTPSSERPPR